MNASKEQLEALVRLCATVLNKLDDRDEEQNHALYECYKVIGIL